MLPSARKLSALDETKIIPQLTVIDEPTRKATAYELIAHSSDELVGGSKDDDPVVAPREHDGRIPEDVRSRAAGTSDEDTRSRAGERVVNDVNTRSGD